MKRCKVIVMDYNSMELHIFNYEGDVIDQSTIEEFITENCSDQGMTFKSSEIHYMIINDPDDLQIYIH